MPNLLTQLNYKSMQCAAYLLSWTTSPLCPLASRIVARGNKPADIVISPRNSDAEYYYVYIHTIHIMSIDMVIENSELMLLLHLLLAYAYFVKYVNRLKGEE